MITPQQRQQAEEERKKVRAEAERQRLMSDEEKVAAAARRKDDYVQGALSRIQLSIEEGRPACIYTTHHIGTQYSVFGKTGGTPFTATSLFEMGWDGWEVVGMVPATTGIPLTNGSGNFMTYGGGIGGLVEGMHILLRFQVTRQLMESRPEAVLSLLAQLYDRHSTEPTAANVGISIEPGSTPPSPGGSGGGFVAFGYSRTVIEDSDSGDDGGGDFDFG